MKERNLYCIEHHMVVAVPTEGHPAHVLCTLEKTWAEFIGWQADPSGGDHFPLFNIAGYHPSADNTVTMATLIRLGIRVPVVTEPCPFPVKR
jgi:hypothetical protein